METKSLVVVILVSCVFLSVCLRPASSQGLRWGREFEEEHPRMKQVRADFLRRKQNERSFDDSAEENGEKLMKKFLLPFLYLLFNSAFPHS